MISLLDFEKSYDRINWSFLKETMQRMGFSDSWIRGRSDLYISAHNQILLASDMGERFAISRSVK